MSTVPPLIYIVSGGTGACAELLVHTVLVQFPKRQVSVKTIASVRQIAQIEDVIGKAKTTGGIIVHTLVDINLRTVLIKLAHEKNIIAIDLMGPLLSHLSNLLGQESCGHPGLYRQLHQAYFDRVEAIEFTMAHDDGLNPQGWPEAEIMLIGVSRVGKTPLSIYLSVLGWKVANTPLILGLPVPQELYQLDSRRVIGLDIDISQLQKHRQKRQNHLRITGAFDYSDSIKIKEELEFARHVFQKGGYSVINVSQKPIETSSNEVIEIITSTLKTD
ncbi:MAG: pyruvate, water dikinase regulatory protein [bacterium]